uniref:DUF1985 domain-containing protein n=1 Tax=Cucumis melo TaxID=3656 RepID=A0A9I9EGN8_CUCME
MLMIFEYLQNNVPIAKRNQLRRKEGEKKTADVEEDYEGAPLILKRSQLSRVQKLNIYARLDENGSIHKYDFWLFSKSQILQIPKATLIPHNQTSMYIDEGDELWFNFKGTIAKFGIKEFEAITGLNCSSLPTLDNSKVRGKFLSKYFKNEDPISRRKIKYKGQNILRKFSLWKTIHHRCDLEHIKQLDDEIQLDAYPWGRISINSYLNVNSETLPIQDHVS